MLLWISLAVLTAAALAVVLRPAFTASSAHPQNAPDIAVYTEQLADLDRQHLAGQLAPAEHAALRHEVARRILRADTAGTASAVAQATAPSNSNILLAVAGAVPVLSLGLYLTLGAPGVPARPFVAATNTALANASAADLIAKVEARLATDPNDGRGWDVIAPVYFRLERFADAAQAYQRAIALLGETPGRLAGFAEATVLASDGIVTEPARAAYEKLVRIVPDRIEPRFWLALAKEQDGQRDAAAADYRALLASAAANDTSRALIEQRLAAVTAAPSTAPRGPTATDVDAASSLNDAERRAMIAQMVDNLATRLKANSRDLEGWQRLVNAYVVLKEPAKARAALADARAAFQDDSAAAPILAELSRRLEALP